MPSFEAGPLPQKLPDLHKEPQVEKAVLRRKQNSRERIPNTPEAKIDSYLKRLEAVFLHPDEERRKRNVDLFKRVLYSELVISEDDAVEERLKVDQKIAYEQGHGVIEITDERRDSPEVRRHAREAIRKQKESLDAWLDYFSSGDTNAYPAWFKYYVLRNVFNLQSLVKEEKEDEETGEKRIVARYPKRNKRTLKPFPDIYRGKLSKIFDIYKKCHLSEEEAMEDPELARFFTEKFPLIYAEESLAAELEEKPENLEETRGEWVKYQQGVEKDVETLVDSLQDKGTDWCTEGKAFAENQLKAGDFYVYYSYDTEGKATNPRIAIRMEGAKIAEVRGIVGGKHQELEPEMIDIATGKLQEFGAEGEKYKKKAADMKRLTALDKAMDKGEEPSFDDLLFLYEVDAPIRGFGNNRDPRIQKLLDQRDKSEDLKTIMEGLGGDRERQINVVLQQEGDQVLEELLRLESDHQKLASLFLKREGPPTYFFIEHSERFQNLDHEVVVREMLEEGSRLGVEKYLDKHAPRLSEETALLIIGPGGCELVATHLFLFPEADRRTLAQAIIRSGKDSEAVLRHMEEFGFTDDESHRWLVREFIDTGQASALPSYLEEFGDIGMAHEDLAYEILRQSRGASLARELKKFELLPASIAQKLLREKYYKEVAENIEVFYELDRREVAGVLLAAGQERVLAGALDKFEDIGMSHQEFAYRLIEKGDGWYVSHNIEKFSGINFEDILRRILAGKSSRYSIFDHEGLSNYHGLSEDMALTLIAAESDGTSRVNHRDSVAYSLESFTGLTSVTAERILDVGYAAYAEKVAENLHTFEYLRPVVAEKLIQTKGEKTSIAVLENLERFENLSHADLASWLVENKQSRLLLDYWDRLDIEISPQEIMLRIIESGNAWDVLGWIQEFPDVDQEKIVQELIRTKQIYVIEQRTDAFRDLPESLALWLIENAHPYWYELPLESFQELSPETRRKIWEYIRTKYA